MPNHSQSSDNKNNYPTQDYLWQHLFELPYFRALLRAVEARFYYDIDLPAPVLDVGCGDGHFATVAFDHQLDVGLDPWSDPIREAAQRGGYHSLIQADGGRMPFPDRYFGSAISNSVLEHIPGIEDVLKEVGRVLKPGAPFVFSVPNHNFNSNLSISRTFNKMRLSALSDAYRRFFDRIARHHHLDPPEVWQTRLDEAGFVINKLWHYYSPDAMRVTEWGHYFGLPSLVSRKITGKWILVPQKWNLALPYYITNKHFEENPIRDDGVCTFYIAQRKRF
jgi:SAM-dependent methyltransferase